MDAEAVVGDLLHNDIIDEGDERDITSARNPTRQNEKLHLCLRRKCTLDTLMTVCDIMTAVRGNPNMLALGEAMKRRLETGMCLCVCMYVCVCVCLLCVSVCVCQCTIKLSDLCTLCVFACVQLSVVVVHGHDLCLVRRFAYLLC